MLTGPQLFACTDGSIGPIVGSDSLPGLLISRLDSGCVRVIRSPTPLKRSSARLLHYTCMN